MFISGFRKRAESWVHFYLVQQIILQERLPACNFLSQNSILNEILSYALKICSLHLNDSAIVWFTPEGEKPSDGSEPPLTCVLHTLASALDVSCEAAIVVANVSGFGFLGLILLVCFVVIKRR